MLRDSKQLHTIDWTFFLEMFNSAHFLPLSVWVLHWLPSPFPLPPSLILFILFRARILATPRPPFLFLFILLFFSVPLFSVQGPLFPSASFPSLTQYQHLSLLTVGPLLCPTLVLLLFFSFSTPVFLFRVINFLFFFYELMVPVPWRRGDFILSDSRDI